MKRIITSVLFTVFFSLTHGQDNYSKISIDIKSSTSIDDIKSLGIAVDHATRNDNLLTFFVNEDELIALNQASIDYNVLIPNYRSYYKQMINEDKEKISKMTRSSFVGGGFGLGSMGGFYTLQEIEDKLDEMYNLYPTIITEKASIGTTFEGRDIWMVKISDNPQTSEAEPKAYFDAIHHAREPLSMAVTINFMFWLLENYGLDDRVTYLIDNRELYFVPIVNPDGYVYNEQIEPNGGGLWRKNRRINSGTSCIGVDLNRNYSAFFGFDNFCSTPDPCSNVYRGEFAFSELESVAIRDFIAQIDPAIGFTTHSTVGVHIMPYSVDGVFSDFGLYSEWASDFLDENNYTYGAAIDLIGYSACGTTDQYLYSEGIHVWTPEIDGAGFWPPPSTIFDLVGENVLPMFFQSWIAGGYVDIQSHLIMGNPVPGETLSLIVEAKNIGLENAENTSVSISSNDPEVIVSGSQDYGLINSRSRVDNAITPFTIDIPLSFTNNSFELTLNTYQEGILNDSFTVEVFIGDKEVLFFDDGESGVGSWTSDGNNINWGLIEDDAYSGNFCFGDSNDGSYQASTNNFFTLDPSIDLTETSYPFVSFMSKYSLSFNDEVIFEISQDDGNSWELLDEFNQNSSWDMKLYDLSAYKNATNVKFRFRLSTNEFAQSDGFYFDDFEISNYQLNILDNTDFLDKSIVLHPNPVNNKLFIETKSNIIIEKIAVFDVQGREVYFDETRQNQFIALDFSQLNTGLYIVRIETQKGLKILKKVIKK